jgi:hypothetical protein
MNPVAPIPEGVKPCNESDARFSVSSPATALASRHVAGGTPTARRKARLGCTLRDRPQVAVTVSVT